MGVVNKNLNHHLESARVQWGEYGQGLVQGDPESGPYYCVRWHENVRELDHILAPSGGLARFGNDDGYAIGPAEIVFSAVVRFIRNVFVHHGLKCQISKTKCFHVSGELLPQAPPDMPAAGVVVNNTWCPGFLFYGVAIGSTLFIKNFLENKISELKRELDKVQEVLKDDAQAPGSDPFINFTFSTA